MTYAAEVAADSPTGYWRFGQQSGIWSYDVGSLAHPMIMGVGGLTGALAFQPPECYSGPVLGGVAFGCWNAAWSTWYPSGAIYGTPCTLECFCWVGAPAVTLSSLSYVMGMGTATNSADAVSMGWNGGKARCYIGSTGVDSTNSFATQTWHHLVFAVDATSSLLYVNGSLEATNSAIANAAREQIHLGFNGPSTLFLKGILAEPAVYASKLSAARIAAHWAAADNMSALPVKLAAAGSVGPPLAHSWQNAP